ncbi:MAG: CusA/CzcA family heavy metal efflux RND transporter [Planctomycetaceae bacterium]|jgi:HME family heavy-metal exporter|nr:CusA/CzcA family heavy metal efflux RND transporter [Planctomycetaceae bacterium]
MLNKLIFFSLRHQLLILTGAFLMTAVGIWQITKMPIDVLPDLNRSRVTVIAECPGMAPEEVELRVTTPLETALNGVSGMEAIRSTSHEGLSTVSVEFNWTINNYLARQIVNERLQIAREMITAQGLSDQVSLQLAPMASIMGQVQMLVLRDIDRKMSPMELRTAADWVVRKRLLSITGISEIFVIGGDRKQYHVLIHNTDMIKYGVKLDQIEEILAGSNENITGGYLTKQGADQYLVRSLGRFNSVNDLKKLVIKADTAQPILLSHVAEVVEAAAVKIGDATAYSKTTDGTIQGGAAVVLTIGKQPDRDTRELTTAILKEIQSIEAGLRQEYPGFRIESLYEQKTFIDLAIQNVFEALWLGAVLVFVILVLFLMNLRTTFISIIAIPLSIVITCFIFAWFKLSINTMTLGGIAIGIGELVDDAIVDVENIFRRLRENFRLEKPRPVFNVIYEASCEIRNSIVFGTIIVTLVFFPIFFLTGIEGRLFKPLALAYITSLLASLLVSLTVTPVMASLLLPSSTRRHREREGLLLKAVKKIAEGIIRFSLAFPRTILAVSLLFVILAGAAFFNMGRDFMPDFNEGVIQVNVSLMPGRSLETTSRISGALARDLESVPGISNVICKTGRSQFDDHVVPVSTSEFLCTIDPDSGRKFDEIVDDVEDKISPVNLPGTVSFYDQPLQHTISHMRSGIQSKIAIKLRGDDLRELRHRAERIKREIEGIPGIGNVRITPIPQDIPQVQIPYDPDRLAYYGLTSGDVNRHLRVAMGNEVVTQLIEGQRNVDVVVKLHDKYREDMEELAHLMIPLPVGGEVPLESLVLGKINMNATGPNQIEHEAARRQMMVQCNPRNRAAIDIKNDIETKLAPIDKELRKDNYSYELAGLFQSEQEASLRMTLLSCISLLAIFMVLYTMFHSANLSLQIMVSLPMALIGAVAAMLITGQNRTVPNLVGMISLLGIASRNGILLIDHYFHLVTHEGENWTDEMIIRAGKDRVAPVLMTALTSTIGLIPLTLAPGMPGREILYPIATVVVGGLLTSTLMEFLVRPALFRLFGIEAAKQAIHRRTAMENPAGEITGEVTPL